MWFLFDSGLFEILFAVIFVLVIGMFLVIFVKGIGEWNRNNHSPRLRVSARVVSRRMDVSHHHDTDDMSHSSTSYYVTFQVESGDRMEFAVSGYEYGMLAEGDQGMLSFQGSRYLGFERQSN